MTFYQTKKGSLPVVDLRNLDRVPLWSSCSVKTHTANSALVSIHDLNVR